MRRYSEFDPFYSQLYRCVWVYALFGRWGCGLGFGIAGWVRRARVKGQTDLGTGAGTAHTLTPTHPVQTRRNEHAEPWNRYMHFAGTTLAVLQLVRDPRLLIAGLVSVGAFCVWGSGLVQLMVVVVVGLRMSVCLSVAVRQQPGTDGHERERQHSHPQSSIHPPPAPPQRLGCVCSS